MWTSAVLHNIASGGDIRFRAPRWLQRTVALIVLSPQIAFAGLSITADASANVAATPVEMSFSSTVAEPSSQWPAIDQAVEPLNPSMDDDSSWPLSVSETTGEPYRVEPPAAPSMGERGAESQPVLIPLRPAVSAGTMTLLCVAVLLSVRRWRRYLV